MDGVSGTSHSFADYAPDYGGYNTVVGAPARYASSFGDFITAFHQFLQQWRSDTALESDLDLITSHPAYLAIVSLGERAVSLVVNELRFQPSLLVYALEDITGERPYPNDIKGDIRAMSNYWAVWADREDAAA